MSCKIKKKEEKKILYRVLQSLCLLACLLYDMLKHPPPLTTCNCFFFSSDNTLAAQTRQRAKKPFLPV
jgi:hypothetical protein